MKDLPANSKGDLAPSETVYGDTLGLASIISETLIPPIDGSVFDLIPKNSGYYTNAGDTLMKIVPDGELEAKIFIKENLNP